MLKVELESEGRLQSALRRGYDVNRRRVKAYFSEKRVTYYSGWSIVVQSKGCVNLGIGR